MSGLKSFFCVALFLCSIFSVPGIAAELSSSTTVQANKKQLLETRSCPQCDLSGANLNRLDLSGANLEGANLSRAQMALTNLSGANLKNCDLREAVFNGADLAEIDLRGADLTGASMVGAYMYGALMDGEIIETSPYAGDEGLKDVKETVYVEDTAKPKNVPETEEIVIPSRRDFEETPPVVPISVEQNDSDNVSDVPDVSDDITLAYEDATLPRQSVAAPEAKAAPAIQEVRIEDVMVEDVIIVPEEVIEQEIKEEKGLIESNAVEEEKEIENAFTEEVQQDVIQGEASPSVSVSEKEKISEVNSTATPVVDMEPEKGGDMVTSPSSDAVSENNKNEEVNSDEGVVSEGQEVGIVETVLSVFSKEEPSGEVMKNVATLLDQNSCYACELSGVDLSGENLDGADLEGANFSNAILKGVDLEGANLKGANFSGADLSGADLSKADLYRAILKDADLTDAKLENTLTDDVDFSETKGYNQPVMMIEQN